MIKKSFTGGFIFISLLFILSTNSSAQTHYILNQESSKMTIQGTSNVHDWEMEVKDIDLSMILRTEGELISGIQETWFSCISTSIVSEYRLMDKKTYEALKTDEYSKIVFRMVNAKVTNVSGSEFSGSASGSLCIAGKTNEVNVPFHGKILDDGQMKVEGEVKLKMTDFDIDPPTALAGTMKTGDEVSIVYMLKLEKDITGKQISEIKADKSIVN